MQTRTWQVAAVAAGSRVAVLFWSQLSVLIVGSYDSSGWLQGATIPLGTNWDAAYYGRIARKGYEFEQFHAFFPLAPIGSKLLAKTATWLLNWSDEWETLVPLAGVVQSNISFVLAACLLYKLGISTRTGEDVAFRAACCFCFNPASVFMSAFYTESLFAMLSFAGMLVVSPNMTNGGRLPSIWRLLLASFFFGLATTTRANGTTLAGYLGYAVLLPFLEGRHLVTIKSLASGFARLILPSFLSSIAPMALILWSAYNRFCVDKETGIFHASVANISPWCNQTIPNIYSYVQSRYWDLGFLRYYQVKQIPNFLLAAPMVSICCLAVWKGLQNLSRETVQDVPHIIHLGFLVLMGLTVMHVQVITRFVASCPYIYWHIARDATPGKSMAAWIFRYFAVFFLLGPAMFSTYYPWS